MLGAASGRIPGKGGDEQSRLRSILDCLERGDMPLGDAHHTTHLLA
ncbi:MAG: hypothetical protein IT529_16770 [Burkholderiales bacterium]|nr:hypothetical protein [Burkholderiales bacterium]